MRRDKTLKVCANHLSELFVQGRQRCQPTELTLIVSADMKLSPNVGSDRSWVWNAGADYAEGEPTAETLAIRFGNAESERKALRPAADGALWADMADANLFKEAFESAQERNAKAGGSTEEADAGAAPLAVNVGTPVLQCYTRGACSG